MEKSLLTAWVGHNLDRAEPQEISRVGLESQIWHLPADSGSVEGGFRKGKMTSAHLSVWEKAVPQLLPSCQTLHFLLVCHWCLSDCYHGARAQKEWVWVSPCMGSLRGMVWNSRSFFHWHNPHWFLQPEVMGTYLSGTGTLGWGPGVGLGFLTPQISLLNFYPPHVSVGPACSMSFPLLLSGWMLFLSFYSCHTSIQFDFWQFWVMVVLYFRCFDAVKQSGEPVYLCHHLDWKLRSSTVYIAQEWALELYGNIRTNIQSIICMREKQE